MNPWGYHAVNLALHLAAVLLLLSVLESGALKALIPRPVAFTAVALFAVHPMLTEPVTYVFARSILIATVFGLLAFRSWLSGREWLAVGWFALAMLGKEECAAIPVVLLVFARAFPSKTRRAPLLAMFVIAIALGVRVIWATSVTAGSGAGAEAGITPLAYFTAESWVILQYFGRVIVPWGFSVDYEATPLPLIAGAGLWILLLAPLAYRKPACWWYLAGLILLLPSSSILPAADLAADRRMYLPMTAFSVCLALLFEKLDRRAWTAVIAILIAISIRYTHLWRSPEALWTEAVTHAPDKVRPRIQLARALPPERSLVVLDEALRLAPNDPSIQTERGRDLLALGRPADALSAFGRALAVAPQDPKAMNNRGTALLALGQNDAARSDFERALTLDPCLFDARLNLLRLGVRTSPNETCRYAPDQASMLGEPPR